MKVLRPTQLLERQRSIEGSIASHMGPGRSTAPRAGSAERSLIHQGIFILLRSR